MVYLLGGNKEQMLGALYNMVGSISGVICEGAKDGCAWQASPCLRMDRSISLTGS
ncbi:MAG: hypothetical protein KAW56_14045 [Candidatus Marinimicrobia bacterium]|nr:hypothetical protein [Candidatus Neomarinimicrobiota bacterium]